MICQSPRFVKLPGKQDKQPVACRKCMPCRIKHSQDWTFRLEKELKGSSSAFFLTLTYRDDCLERNDLGHPVLVPEHLTAFWKSLRKYQARLTNRKIRYYAVGEYGGETIRPHYHAIVFNLNQETVEKIHIKWHHGFVKIGTVTQQSISYVTKYITKIDTRQLDQLELVPQFARMSNQPGIGANYLNDENIEYHSREDTRLTVNKGKKRRRLPTYYTDKLYPKGSEQAQLVKAIETNKLKIRSAKFAEARAEKLRASGHNPEEYLSSLTEQQLKQIEKRNKRNKL